MSRLQLYSLATPNGQKASICLEEMALEYDAHKIDIIKGDQFTPEFGRINPNSKIPALVDPVGDGGKPLAIMESGAILVYLAERTKMFYSDDPVKKSKILQWLFFQVGGVGPMFGQFGHFYKYAKNKCEHPYPVERYSNEAKRLLQVMDSQLARNQYIAGDELTIADFATAPWVLCLDKFYEASEHLELAKMQQVNRWLNELLQRPAFQRGLEVCPF